MELEECDILNLFEIDLNTLLRWPGWIKNNEIHQDVTGSVDSDGNCRGIDTNQVQTKPQLLTWMNIDRPDLELLKMDHLPRIESLIKLNWYSVYYPLPPT